MVIVFVEDNYAHETDGTAVSAHRFRAELIKRGHTVRVLAIGVEGPDMYGLKEHYVPVVTPVAARNNMRFGKFDRAVVTRAFTGADLVYLFFPWQLERRCLALARKMNIPVCGAFHCQPENVTYNMKIKLLDVANTFLYFLFRLWLYRNLDNIHCPSPFAAGELRKHRYHARLHPISNGIQDVFKPFPGEAPKEDHLVHILMTGRIAEEKRQDLLIKAVKHSRYRDRIQIHFVGRGPMYRAYSRLGKDLPLPPDWVREFIPQEDLLKLIHRSDFYVHTSEVELESIACLEAVSCGKVPVISDSPRSAATQFALDERSLFRKGRYLDLRDRIDYWIEHPEERERMGREYARLGAQYNISHSIKKVEKMFGDALRDHKTRRLIEEDKKIARYHRLVDRKNHVKEFFCGLFYFAMAIPLLILLNRSFFGLVVKNRKILRGLKKTGAVLVCNHVHEMDSAMCAVAAPFRKLIFVSLPRNFNLGVAGFFVDVLGSVPAPSSPREMQVFIYSLSKHLRRGRTVLFYPEGELRPYSEALGEFQRGAFYLAADAQVPVFPIRIVFRPPSGILGLLRKKPCFTMICGEPVYPNHLLLKDPAMLDLQQRTEAAMHSLAP